VGESAFFLDYVCTHYYIAANRSDWERGTESESRLYSICTSYERDDGGNKEKENKDLRELSRVQKKPREYKFREESSGLKACQAAKAVTLPPQLSPFQGGKI